MHGEESITFGWVPGYCEQCEKRRRFNLVEFSFADGVPGVIGRCEVCGARQSLGSIRVDGKPLGLPLALIRRAVQVDGMVVTVEMPLALWERVQPALRGEANIVGWVSAEKAFASRIANVFDEALAGAYVDERGITRFAD